MLSQTQLDFLEPFIAQHYKEGFIYYVANTNTNLSSSSNYSYRDITVIFSKEPIICTNSTNFGTANSCVRYDVITRNASRDYTEPRIVKSTLSSLNYNVPTHEFVVSNAKGAETMNLIATEEYMYQNNLSYSIGVNEYYVIPFILCITLLSTWLFSWFGRVRGSNV